MFLQKIKTKESGILIYGICPPKIHTAFDKVVTGANKVVHNLHDADIDALIVYDVQDESARTSEERPFPFVSAMDPLEYASQYLQGLTLPKIIYRPAGKFSKQELSQWLGELRKYGFHPVFVGLPSPDYVVKTSLTDAYALWREEHVDNSAIGAVMIPERHAVLNDEQVRILDKVNSGVTYFVSQCVFNVEYAKKVLDDLVIACRERNAEIPVMIFTLTICGSLKTLQFMEWLGIYIPDDIRDRICGSSTPVKCSVDIATKIASDLIDHCMKLEVPFGFNIESVATRKEEVDASLQLLNTVNGLLRSHGFRSDSQRVSKRAANS